MPEFWTQEWLHGVESWLHGAPDPEFAASGKRAVVRHACFGPLETWTWFERKGGGYCRQVCLLEGIQAGDVYEEAVSTAEMAEVLETEIALCKKYGQAGLASVFQAERDQLAQKMEPECHRTDH